MLNKLLLPTGLLLILFSCAKENKTEITEGADIIKNPEYGELQNAENSPVRFELVNSTELIFEDDLIIGSINAFTVDDDGNMYFVDSRQGKMVSLDTNGEFRFVTG
ncbi:MAG TPA: hypothetical protein DCL80_01230, partial [Balneola sp.]|nr:hypothetical protein [Balneola sp.]